MRIRRRHNHDIPALNTASLPDLIFTVLFFFMIVTHMRKDPLRVTYQVPQGTELTRLTKKSAVTYIYIGKPVGSRDSTIRVQINDRFVAISEIAGIIEAERDKMSPDDARQMIVSVKADKSVPMGIVSDVKQALRKAGALRVNYSAVSSRNR